jgi:hypothetical protein
MLPSTWNRIGAIAPLACALLWLTSCNQATHPTYPENAEKGGIIGSGDFDDAGGNGINRGLIGSWRRCDIEGNEFGWGDTTIFDVKGNYSYKRTPPAQMSLTYYDQKGTYSTSGDTLFVSLTSDRYSFDGKEWSDFTPADERYLYSIEGTRLTLTDIWGYSTFFTR